MDLQTVLAAIESWRTEDRLELIERAWNGLASTSGVSDLTETEKLDLQYCLDAYRDDPEVGSTWEEVKTRHQGHHR